MEDEKIVETTEELVETEGAATEAAEEAGDKKKDKKEKKEKKESNVDPKEMIGKVTSILGGLFLKKPKMGMMYAQIIIGLLIVFTFGAGLGSFIIGLIVGGAGIYGLQTLKGCLKETE